VSGFLGSLPKLRSVESSRPSPSVSKLRGSVERSISTESDKPSPSVSTALGLVGNWHVNSS